MKKIIWQGEYDYSEETNEYRVVASGEIDDFTLDVERKSFDAMGEVSWIPEEEMAVRIDGDCFFKDDKEDSYDDFGNFLIFMLAKEKLLKEE